MTDSANESPMPLRSPRTAPRSTGRPRVGRAPLLLGLCSLLSLHAPLALAQSGSEANDVSGSRPQLDTLIQQGIELRRAGKDEQALQAFLEAEALARDSVRVRVHLASTHQALGHWLEADAYLRGVLSQPDDPYVTRHRATLEQAAQFVGQHVGSVEVTGTPVGAEVSLNGRRIGALPLPAVRAPIGSYQLQVQKEGFYEERRPIVLSNRGVIREAVELVPIAQARPVAASPSAAREVDRGLDSPRWLSWTLTGLSVGAAAATGVSLALREKSAKEWNSADCLEPGRTRGEVCPVTLDNGRNAERVAYVSGVATLLFAAGAIVSWTLDEPDVPATASLSASCGIMLGGATCVGSF
jgi:PEGA domain-containing protein